MKKKEEKDLKKKIKKFEKTLGLRRTLFSPPWNFLERQKEYEIIIKLDEKIKLNKKEKILAFKKNKKKFLRIKTGKKCLYVSVKNNYVIYYDVITEKMKNFDNIDVIKI